VLALFYNVVNISVTFLTASPTPFTVSLTLRCTLDDLTYPFTVLLTLSTVTLPAKVTATAPTTAPTTAPIPTLAA